eukprot:1160564-Pelagomonas_calceolata.AAC.1
MAIRLTCLPQLVFIKCNAAVRNPYLQCMATFKLFPVISKAKSTCYPEYFLPSMEEREVLVDEKKKVPYFDSGSDTD